jgi:hypothetical protein
MRKLLALAALLAAVMFVAGCFGLNDSTPPAAQQQGGPVVVPVINQSTDSGLYVLATIGFVVVIIAVGLAMYERGKNRAGAQVSVPSQLEARVRALETGEPLQTEAQRLDSYGYNSRRAINR